MDLDPFDILLGSIGNIGVISKFVPGVTRKVTNRIVLSKALGSYQVPANDHLRRALRLSWLRAATALMHACLDRSKNAPDHPDSRHLAAFRPIFEATIKENIATVCNIESGRCIGDSPIDGHLDVLIEAIPDHLVGTSVSTELSDTFDETLMALTGVARVEVPDILFRAACEGIAPNNKKHRTFGQLFADEFAKVIQSPTYYPEAKASIEVIQANATNMLVTALHAELRALVEGLPENTAQAVVARLEALPENWLTEGMRPELQSIDKRLSSLNATMVAIQNSHSFDGRADQSTVEVRQSAIDNHTPYQDRTIMFAGSCALEGHAARHIGRLCDQVSRRANRLGESAKVIPLQWDFSTSLELESRSGKYAQQYAWETLDEKVIGAVLLVGPEAPEPIVPDERFLDLLDERGWLWEEGREENGPFDDVHELKGRRLRDFFAAGGVPINYETRFAVECLERGVLLSAVLLADPNESNKPVANFVAFLEGQGVDVVFLKHTEQGKGWDETFVTQLPGVSPSSLPNPYRALDYYQIDDADSYVGREREAAVAHADIKLSVECNEPLILGITGPSGCGKSSFMRARVAADASEALKLNSLDMRPTDFRVQNDVNVRCLTPLCTQIAVLLEGELPDDILDNDRLHHSLLLPRMQKWIDEIISERAAGPSLICLDQFEEILDDLSEGVNENEWRAMFSLLRHLNEHHRWPIVFTLEDSRKDRFEEQKEAIGFSDAILQSLPDNDDKFYRSVIATPFQDVGIDLHPDVIAILMNEVAQLQNDTSVSASPLPLLALQLYTLFRDLSPKAPKKIQQARLSGSFNRLVVTEADLTGRSLALGEMVADLAETAWALGEGDDDAESIKFFLKPLVRISANPTQLGEGKMVLKSIRARGFRSERSLHDAFLSQRLLVPSAGGFRLVHEAVIRRWPRARKWFEKDREALEKESRFRTNAMHWNDEGRPELETATEENIAQAAKVLSDHIRDWSSNSDTHLDEEAKLLKEYAKAVFSKSRTPRRLVFDDEPSGMHIHLAASFGLNDLIKKFLTIDPEALDIRSQKSGRSPLANAAWSHLSTVKLLLKKGANPALEEKMGFTPLDAAVWGERLDILEAMLKHSDAVKWSKKMANPIGGAARYCRVDIAERLVQHGFRHDQAANSGWTPLHQAALVNDRANFRYFMDRGDLRAQNSDGLTPLHLAASAGHLEIVSEILTTAEGSELLEDPKSYWGTPLMIAALHHRVDVVEFIMNFASNINGVPNYEITEYSEHNALHMALVNHFDNPSLTTDYTRRSIFAVVNSLVKDKSLDVAKRVERRSQYAHETADEEYIGKGITSWEMASGMPEVQQLIANHPRFPDDFLEELEEAKRKRKIARGPQDLFDAAKRGDRRTFERIMDYTAKGINADFHGTVGEEETSTAELLIKQGWTDLVLDMLEVDQIIAWPTEVSRSILYAVALRQNALELVAKLEETMPVSIPESCARSLLNELRASAKKIDDPDEQILNKLLNHIKPETATALLFDAARIGDSDVMNRLISLGGDENSKDIWDRTVTDVMPNLLRAERRLPPLGVFSRAKMGDSLFYPDAKGWEPLNDLSIVHGVENIDGLPCDDRAVWTQRSLSFYPDPKMKLLHAKHPDWDDALQIYFLANADDLTRLDGTSPPIHMTNAEQSLVLNEETVLDYLQFFCFFVRGEDGPFYILDSSEARYLPKTLTQQEKGMLQDRWQPPRLWGSSEDGHFRISAPVYYGNALFISEFEIQLTGMLDMTEDHVITGDLSTKVWVPITKQELNSRGKFTN